MQGQRNTVQSLQEKIAQRAYELYLQRGQYPGHEVEDWLEAERQIFTELRSSVYQKSEASRR
jgi:DNA-binding SARP family transcriptional activator